MLNKCENLMLHQTGEKKRFKQTKFQPDLVPEASHTLNLDKAAGITYMHTRCPMVYVP